MIWGAGMVLMTCPSMTCCLAVGRCAPARRRRCNPPPPTRGASRKGADGAAMSRDACTAAPHCTAPHCVSVDDVLQLSVIVTADRCFLLHAHTHVHTHTHTHHHHLIHQSAFFYTPGRCACMILAAAAAAATTRECAALNVDCCIKQRQ